MKIVERIKQTFIGISWVFIIWVPLIFSQLAMTGCSWLSPSPSDDPRARQIVEQLKNTNATLKEFKELAHIRLGFQQAFQSVSMALAAAPPNRMRVELLSVVGQPLTSLVADGETIHIRPHGNERTYKLRQSATALEQFIHIPLGIEQLHGILIGRPILPEYRFAQLKAFNGDIFVIELKSRWQKLAELEFDATNSKIRMLEVYNAEGDPRYRIDWIQWRRVGQYDLPSKFKVIGGDGYKLTLQMKRFWPDVVLSAETFILDRSNSGNP